MAPVGRATPIGNTLLAALPRALGGRFIAECEVVPLVFADVLCEAGECVRHVYFPTRGFISVLTPTQGKQRLELGMVGREGMYGISLLLGVDTSVHMGLVQGAGTALRMKSTLFRRELAQNPLLKRALDRYLYVVMAQLGQSALCAAFHSVDARLARWLLMSHDRAGADEFDLTQEFLAYMLGVRRAGVSGAAQKLQRKDCIRYSRGRISIRNRKALEQMSCPCYRQDLEVYESQMGRSQKKP